MDTKRHYSLFDKLCLGLDQAVRALSDTPKTSGRPYPADKVAEERLSEEARKHAAGLMRINHAGEICAQALYHGQGIVSRTDAIQRKMQAAAIEEGDHLAWCKQRLDELGSHPTYLSPFWYAGSFCIGMTAGLIGDKWSLGFVAETERQVIKHLEGHLKMLPSEDKRSYKILAQMEADEAKHRDEAIAQGANELPRFIKKGMTLVSTVMVKTAYWL
ncbi:MAG: 2-octaprenyl-3-methyl-6-methoxy-1,4-benzoquinol hydroxylase [Gammaproteobacteria bacterium RIFCSPHIGHO2_12_FULL_43_28]|nr:MAG: 2-octaprenyl-3-methyl-6-methoxy-1,4-benzoquinol hydroxylase [Gammaproteobacteria bacterium RIFCSPHIGHO2_12_FULL_43_28]